MSVLQRVALNVSLFPILILMAAGTCAALSYIALLELIDRTAGAALLPDDHRQTTRLSSV